jgi:LmbE family N-acetylglucosaminyl deacetylase
MTETNHECSYYELLGVGGTAASHVARGDSVTLAVVCEGVSMRYAPERHAEVRAQTAEAARILGVTDVSIGALPDQRLDTIPVSDVAAAVEAIVKSRVPDVVYTHFPGDLNRDHRIVAEATMIACRPYASSVRELLFFETPSSTEWGAIGVPPAFTPNVFVDISATLDQKISAMACYTEEVRDYPHPRSLESLRVRARAWGSQVGCEAAEAFVAARILR